jgi:hypothetical protein
VSHIFPTHPHIYRFIELLRIEHAFEQHKAEETFVYMCNQRKISDKIDAQLTRLLGQHTKREISDLQFDLSCGEAVTTKLIKKN